MNKFFNPKTVAIIGASTNKEKVGGIILHNLLDLGYTGKIFPVNPKYDKIGQLKCYKDISEVDSEVDLVAVAIPAEAVAGAVEKGAKKGIKNFVVISAGFSETGKEGKKREEELEQLALKYDLKIVGPNCLGILNTEARVNISFSKNNFSKGQVGLIMQSGALVTAFFDLSGSENIGFSLVVTMGNKMQLDEVDFLKYFKNDSQTKVIGVYLEDIRRGKEFCQILREVTLSKPVVVLKAGSSNKTKAAIMSHTGAMAGEAEVAKEAILQNGGIYTDDFLEFIEIIKILNGFEAPLGGKTVIVTNAGGPGVIATDLVEKDKWLELFDFSDQDKNEFRQVLPGSSSVSNPIDLLGDAGEERYRQVFEILARIKGIGSVMAIITPQSGTDVKEIARVLVEANRGCEYPILPVVMGSQANAEAMEVFKKNGMTNFIYPGEAIIALGNYVEMLSRNKMAAKVGKQMPDLDRQEKAKLIYNKVRQEKRDKFYFEEAAELAEMYKMKTVKYYYLNQSHGFDIKFPLVMKVDSPEILHKDKYGGVVLDIEDAERLRLEQEKLEKKFENQKILIQEQARAGVELIMGVKKDANFGAVVMLGLGGVATEILKERIFWLLPTSLGLIKEKISDSTIGEIIAKQRLDLDEVTGEMFKLASLAYENKWIKEMDINPIIFYPNMSAVGVDIKVII